jgi:hypothetical protein
MPITLSIKIQEILQQCFSNNCGDTRAFDLFIPPLGGDGVAVPSGQHFPLIERLPQALQDGTNSILLFGDSGLGKTTLSLWLCAYFWDHLETYGRIPLYIHLPQVVRNGLLPEDILDVFLKNYCTEEERLEIKRQPLLVVLDGYDEISDRRNIHSHNQWYRDRGFDIQVVTTCRPEAFNSSDNIRSLFEVNGQLNIFYLQEFAVSQIQDYLKLSIDCQSDEFREQYAGTPWVEDWQYYDDWLTRLPSLKVLAKTPNLLSLIVQALPRIAEEHTNMDEIEQSKLTQKDVFEAFVDSWFLRQAMRLEKKGELRELNQEQICGYLKAYAQNLAASLILRNGYLSQRLLKDSDTLLPHLAEPTHDARLLHEYEASHRNLFQYSDENGVVIPNEANLRVLRSGCLLKTVENRFKFLHKSLVEFLATRELFTGLQGEYDLYMADAAISETSSGLNRQLIKDKALFVHLVERLHENPRFKDLLFEILEGSKTVPGLGIMAANAITVLNRAGVNLSGFDFQDVQISGADLQYAVCDRTDFRGADLSNVRFHGAQLTNARWDGANCSNLTFGERAALIHPTGIRKVAFYQGREASYWITQCFNGLIYQWNSETHQLFRTYRSMPWFNGLVRPNWFIAEMAVSNNQHLLIVILGAVFGPVGYKTLLWSLQTGNFIKNLGEYQNGWVSSLTVSCLGDLFATGTSKAYKHYEHEIRLCDLSNGKLKHSLYLTRSSYSQGIDWSPDERLRIAETSLSNRMFFSPVGDLFAKLWEGRIHVWKLPDGKKEPLLGVDIQCICFSTDGGLLIGVSNFSCFLWRKEDMTVVQVLSFTQAIKGSYHFSPNGKWLFRGDMCKSVEWVSFQDFGKRFYAHADEDDGLIQGVACDSQSNWVASGDCRGIVRIWSTPNELDLSLRSSGKDKYPLILRALSINQAIGLSNMALDLCKQKGARGEPASHQQPYRAWCTIFQPIPGTASAQNPFSLLSKDGSSRYRISEENWVVAIVRKTEGSQQWSLWRSIIGNESYHTYLLIEGMKNHRRFLIHADLRVDDNNKVIIEAKSLCEDGTLNDKHSINSFKSRLNSSQIKAWSIQKDTGKTLLSNIRSDQHKTLAYAGMSLTGSLGSEYQNCVVWCKRQLRKIDLNLPTAWYEAIVVPPSEPFIDVEDGGFSCAPKL